MSGDQTVACIPQADGWCRSLSVEREVSSTLHEKQFPVYWSGLTYFILRTEGGLDFY